MAVATFPFSNALASIVRHAQISGQPVLLVKDRGLYMMVRGLQRADGTQALCAYALGCDPDDKSGPDNMGWYDRARDIAGGDDFAEEIPASDIAAMIRGDHGLKITFSESHLSMCAA